MNKHSVGQMALDAVGKCMPVCALRGMDLQAHQEGDIDIIVPPNMALQACQISAQAAQEKGLALVGFRNIGYVCSIVLIEAREENSDLVVKLDFISGFAWYGEGLNESLANPFSDRWSKLHENFTDLRIIGAITFFQKIMACGSLTSKEWSRITSSNTDTVYLSKLARKLRLPISLEDIEARKIGILTKWKLRAASCGVDGPLAALIWFKRVCIAHFKFKLGVGTDRGVVFGISGLDGSGKSTIVERLLRVYSIAWSDQPILIHLLPSWIPMPHQILRRQKTSDNYTRPYSEPPVSSKLNGNLRLGYYIVAFILVRISLVIQAVRGNIIIMDRSIVDFCSDLTRARIPANKIPNWIFRMLLPRGQLFYLDVHPEVAIARKGELSIKKANELRGVYHEICSENSITILDGNNKPNIVFSNFVRHLSYVYMLRINTILGR